ncbi:MAG: 30S ribosomal protein S12 methylthiotransferase RimO [candidate division WOR-3 bacterium]|nr:30S ribosomal protein S12 methylthiotransferase RimO [candidate division WOR-3 bacterium]
MKVAVISLGCPKNLVDSEVILGELAQEKYSLTSKWFNADVVIINTCAFIRSAVREAEQWIKEVLAHKKLGKIRKVIITGCLVERYRQDLLKRFPEIDCIVSIDESFRINAVLKTSRKKLFISTPPSRLLTSATPRIVTTNSFAYLKIADGCNNRCSYCLIPHLRGPFRSRSINDITEEATLLVNLGIKELILIAQDTTLYGKDLYHKLMLPNLLNRLLGIKDVHWLRLLYTHPAHFTDQLISLFHNAAKLCRYIDLPIQHVSDRILKLMNRKYTSRDLRKLLDKLHKIPNIAIRSTVIVGFPSETEKEFQELLDFVKTAQFAHLGCFVYSQEKGTVAFKLPEQIPWKIKHERYKEVMKVQKNISQLRLKNFIGKELDVIIDEELKTGVYSYKGRTEFDAPEIDGTVYIKCPKSATNYIRIGDIKKVKIIDAGSYDLFGEIVTN